MGLTINAFGISNATDIAGQNIEQIGAKQNKQNVFGGNLNLANDPIAKRREEAQKQAWKVVKDAWDNDNSVDESMQVRRDHYAEMEALQREATAELADVNDDKEVLRELYDVAEDSKEQQDLELLEKEQDYKNGVSLESFSKEELDRLGELHQQPLTEYQERALELNDRAGNLKNQIQDATRQMQDDTADLRSIKQERLKSNPMLEAQQTKDAIMEAANDEIIGMLVQEAQEHIDEKMEEAKEKAEKSMEEKEEREEQREAIKLERAVQEAIIEGTKEAAEKAESIARQSEAPSVEITEMVDIASGKDMTKDARQSLEEIKSSMNLLEADLKGIKVDEEV